MTQKARCSVCGGIVYRDGKTGKTLPHTAKTPAGPAPCDGSMWRWQR